jgi:dihydroxyacetone kinase
MKKFINQPENVVEEMLDGWSLLHPEMLRLSGHKVMIRADAEQARDRQVAIISGGGSGHEPAHAGYIGTAMLGAAVAGEVFTSPSSDSVFAAIKAVTGKPGVLLIVKNYTGDRLNFGLAAEMARAEGIPVEMIIVDDDVALKEAGQAVGARGLAGVVLIHKLAGAAAAEGKTLAEISVLAREAIRALGTMGVSFSAGTSPAVGKPSFELGADEMELGLGIHGEPGVKRTQIMNADQLTEILLKTILRHAKFEGEKRVVAMVNNLGATTEMELAIVVRHAFRFLESDGFTVERIYAGTFLSSLDMAGISMSILGVNEDRLRWLDAATSAPAWHNLLKQRPGRTEQRIAARESGGIPSRTTNSVLVKEEQVVGQAIEAACQALIRAEPELTELDRITGDGDLGTNMKRAALAVLNEVKSYPLDNIPGTLRELGHTLRRELGGSSGPLYGVLFLRSGNVLAESASMDAAQWIEALDQGCRAVSALGGAMPGDRTMLDALDPFVKSLKEAEGNFSQETLLSAVRNSERGADSTSEMKPRLGRSSYLGDRVLGHPDPGAKAAAIWLRAVCEILPNLKDA